MVHILLYDRLSSECRRNGLYLHSQPQQQIDRWIPLSCTFTTLSGSFSVAFFLKNRFCLLPLFLLSFQTSELHISIKFFSALQSYCSRLLVGLLSYDGRSTLIWLDLRKKSGRDTQANLGFGLYHKLLFLLPTFLNGCIRCSQPFFL